MAEGIIRKKFLFKILFSVSILLILVWYVDIRELTSQLGNIDPLWLGIATIVLCLSVMLGGFNLYFILGIDQKIGFFPYLKIFWFSWAVAQFIPAQIGDILSMSTLLKRQGLDLHAVVSRVLIDKFISLIVVGIYGGMGLIIIISPKLPIPLLVFFPVLFLLIALIVIVLFFLRSFKQVRFPLIRHLAEIVDKFLVFFQRYPEYVIINLLLTMVKIAAMSFTIWLLFYGLGVSNVGILDVIMLNCIVLMVGLIPVSVNGLGTMEAAAVILFATLGVGNTDTAAAFILYRILAIVLSCLPSGYWLLFSSKYIYMEKAKG